MLASGNMNYSWMASTIYSWFPLNFWLVFDWFSHVHILAVFDWNLKGNPLHISGFICAAVCTRLLCFVDPNLPVHLWVLTVSSNLRETLGLCVPSLHWNETGPLIMFVSCLPGIRVLYCLVSNTWKPLFHLFYLITPSWSQVKSLLFLFQISSYS